jgi:hypothetical protein
VFLPCALAVAVMNPLGIQSFAENSRSERSAGQRDSGYREEYPPPPPRSVQGDSRGAEQYQAELARQKREKERRRSPDAKAERMRSRLAYVGKSSTEARRIARVKHGQWVERPVWKPYDRRHGERVVKYVDDRAAVVDPGNGQDNVLVESLLPLRTTRAGGGKAPVDLTLAEHGGDFVPENPFVATRIPKRLADGVLLGDIDLRMTPVAGTDASPPTLVDGKPFWANIAQDTDLFITPRPGGVQTFHQLRSERSPERLDLRFALPAGATIVQPADEFGGLRIIRGAEVLASLSAPAAWDAEGAAVPVDYEVSGQVVTLRVDHRAGDFAYPLLVDPEVVEDFRRWDTNLALDFNGWTGFHTNDPFPGGYHWVMGDPKAAAGDQPLIEDCERCEPFTGPPQVNNPLKYPTRWGLHIFFNSELNAESSRWYGLYQSCHGPNLDRCGYVNWAEFDFRAPQNAHVYRADFEDYLHQSDSTCVKVGIYGGPSVNDWEREQTGCRLGAGEDVADASLCVDSTCNSGAGSTGNQAQFSVQMFEAGYRSRFRIYLPSAAIWLADKDSPQLSASNTPRGWTGDAAAPVEARGTDNGLGMRRLRLYAPNASGWTGAQDMTSACTGNRHARCPKTMELKRTVANLPEGENTVTAEGWDIIDHSGSTQWTVKVDRSPPSQPELSGGLYDRRNAVAPDAVHSLRAESIDGSATDPRSGVERLSYELKAGPVVVDSGTQRNPNCTASSGCSLGFGADFQIDTRDLPRDQTYTVEVTARDQVGAKEPLNEGSHRSVESFTFRTPDDSAPPLPASDVPAHACQFRVSGPASAYFHPILVIGSGDWEPDANFSYSLTGEAKCAPDNAPRSLTMSGHFSQPLRNGSGGKQVKACQHRLLIPSQMSMGGPQPLVDEPFELELATGAAVSPQPAQLSFKRLTGHGQGTMTLTGTCNDVSAAQLEGTFELVGWHPKDTTGPRLEVSGALKDRANKGLYEPAYDVRVKASDGSASEPQSGVRSIEYFVDGISKGKTEKECTEGNCALAHVDRFISDDYADGERQIKVVAKDEAGNTAEDPWRVFNDRRGDIYTADEYIGSQSNLTATESAKLEEPKERREIDDEIKTRTGKEIRSTTKPDDPNDPEEEVSYATRIGRDDSDPNLPPVASMKAVRDGTQGSEWELVETGPLATALADWQYPPPASGPLFDHKRKILDGRVVDIWREASTRLPLKQTAHHSDTGELLGTHYWSYHPERRTDAEVPSDWFAVARRANTGYEEREDFGYQPGSSVRDEETGIQFAPRYLGSTATLASGPLCFSRTLDHRSWLTGNSALGIAEPTPLPADEDGYPGRAAPSTGVDAYYVPPPAGGACTQLLDKAIDTPPLVVWSMAADSSEAEAWTDVYKREAEQVALDPNHPDVAFAGVSPVLADNQPTTAYVIADDAGDWSSFLVQIGNVTVMMRGPIAKSEVPALVASLRTL